jgi:hypothetical protein
MKHLALLSDCLIIPKNIYTFFRMNEVIDLISLIPIKTVVEEVG